MTFLGSILVPLIPKIADFVFTVVSIMAGSIVIVGEGWGKIRFQDQFASFWKLFTYLLLEIGIYVLFTDPATNYIEFPLTQNVAYVLGITTGALATFFLWFVYSFDFSITTGKKWVFALVFYAITALNFLGHL